MTPGIYHYIAVFTYKLFQLIIFQYFYFQKTKLSGKPPPLITPCTLPQGVELLLMRQQTLTQLSRKFII